MPSDLDVNCDHDAISQGSECATKDNNEDGTDVRRHRARLRDS